MDTDTEMVTTKDQCTKCKSRDIYTREQKTSRGDKISVVFCRRCKTETRATLILPES